MEVGLACTVCGQLNPLRAQSCSRCQNPLAPAPVGGPQQQPGGYPQQPQQPPGGYAPQQPQQPGGYPPQPGQPQQPYAPSQPSAPAGPPPGAPRFDPVTGQPLDQGQPEKPAAKTMFFGALQQQAVTPRLVVIKGEGGDGVTYHLTGQVQSVGRNTGEITFNDDVFLSPEHAKFTVQDSRLFVQDAGSANGVFLRIKRPTPLDNADLFLVGEELLKLDSEPLPEYGPRENGTYFYGSPRPDAQFRLIQQLAGGGEGLIRSARGGTLSIGREGNTLNFPTDRFISGHHAQLDVSSDTGQVVLTDTGSRNGTFVRIKGAQELHHGDYLFVGQQLFRVEIS